MIHTERGSGNSRVREVPDVRFIQCFRNLEHRGYPNGSQTSLGTTEKAGPYKGLENPDGPFTGLFPTEKTTPRLDLLFNYSPGANSVDEVVTRLIQGGWGPRRISYRPSHLHPSFPVTGTLPVSVVWKQRHDTKRHSSREETHSRRLTFFCKKLSRLLLHSTCLPDI